MWRPENMANFVTALDVPYGEHIYLQIYTSGTAATKKTTYLKKWCDLFRDAAKCWLKKKKKRHLEKKKAKQDGLILAMQYCIFIFSSSICDHEVRVQVA